MTGLSRDTRHIFIYGDIESRKTGRLRPLIPGYEVYITIKCNCHFPMGFMFPNSIYCNPYIYCVEIRY